jgi:hypothetical protein
MQLNEQKIKYMMQKYKQEFAELEHYDLTREKLWARKRIDITLNQRVINKLKQLRLKKKKPISRIIEEAVEKL